MRWGNICKDHFCLEVLDWKPVRSSICITTALLIFVTITSVATAQEKPAPPLDPKSQEVINLIKEARNQRASGNYDTAHVVLQRALDTAIKQFGDADLL